MLDISISQRTNRRCDGGSRRDFLRIGGLSAFGLSLGHLLKAEALADTTKPSRARAKSVILVFLGGGISQHDTFDLKPDAPVEVR